MHEPPCVTEGSAMCRFMPVRRLATVLARWRGVLAGGLFAAGLACGLACNAGGRGGSGGGVANGDGTAGGLTDPASDGAGDEVGGGSPSVLGGEEEVGAPVPSGVSGADDGASGGAGVGTGIESAPGVLTAGSFDDNLNFGVYERFVSESGQDASTSGYPAVSPGRRTVITVRNEAGEPVADARVVVTAAGDDAVSAPAPVPLLDLTTGSDGRVVLLTGFDGGADATALTVSAQAQEAAEPFVVSAAADEVDITITLPGAAADPPSQLDLAFVFDCTGSMFDELEYLTAEIDGIATAVAARFPEVSPRYGLVVYRDAGDDYVTLRYDFTMSLSAFQASLAEQAALGGGDYAEAMHRGLEEAGELAWRGQGTARVLFLVADAPPHAEFAVRTLAAVQALRSAGVAVYPVAASGVDSEAELILRTAAVLTLGQYIFLTDDSGVGDPHAEPHIPCYVVEELSATLIRMIVGELSGRRIEADPGDILRVLGNPVNGICEAEPAGQNG